MILAMLRIVVEMDMFGGIEWFPTTCSTQDLSLFQIMVGYLFDGFSLPHKSSFDWVVLGSVEEARHSRERHARR